MLNPTRGLTDGYKASGSRALSGDDTTESLGNTTKLFTPGHVLFFCDWIVIYLNVYKYDCTYLYEKNYRLRIGGSQSD